MSGTSPAPAPDLHAMLAPIARAGLVAALVSFGGFGAWSVFAPLSSAAVAPGIVSPGSSRKTVQHLEGGIVEEILVDEGDRVSEGDVLVRLSPVQARASHEAGERRRRRLQAERLRLEALERGLDRLAWPPSLHSGADAGFRAFLANQEALFAVESRALAEKQAIFDRRTDQIRAEITAILRENEGLRQQLAIVDEDIADKQTLHARQLLRKSELLLLRRQRAELQAGIAANEADIARAGQRIAEAAIARTASATEARDLFARELARIGTELASLEETLAASRDVMLRTEVTAPVSGTVIDLRARTPGGILRAGDPVLDIVPEPDRLVVDARLAPNDIDSVSEGQQARVHLTPYSARDIPPLRGRVVRVDADVTVDAASRERFYGIRVEVDAEQFAPLAAAARLKPGMPAEVFVVTGRLSLFEYLLAPLARSFRRAFREQ